VLSPFFSSSELGVPLPPLDDSFQLSGRPFSKSQVISLAAVVEETMSNTIAIGKSLPGHFMAFSSVLIGFLSVCA
jgi:hypothetical protein